MRTGLTTNRQRNVLQNRFDDGVVKSTSRNLPPNIGNSFHNPFINDLGPLLAEFYSSANWTSAETEFVREHRLSMDEVTAHAGALFLQRCRFNGSGFFEFDNSAGLAVIFEVLAEDDETVIDLCSFDVACPNIFGTALGAAAILGATNITNPSTWAFGQHLKIHRAPLDWLKDGCRGAVILNHHLAPLMLGRALGPIFAEDEAHVKQLRAAFCAPLMNPRQIRSPVSGGPHDARQW